MDNEIHCPKWQYRQKSYVKNRATHKYLHIINFYLHDALNSYFWVISI